MKKPQRLRDRAAQLIMPRLGSNMPPAVSADADADRILALLERVPVGGLVLFRGAAATTPAVLERIQAASHVPLLVASDFERGAGQQLAGATVFPHAMAFGRLSGDAAAAVAEAARITASEARAGGVHWIFAPVADVHSNPVNPIISTRAFGQTPEQCARLVEAHIAGCRLGGALSTAKHFPGHGDTETDSHAELPFVSRSRGELDDLEFPPFRAAIEAGVDSIMTAHVAYSALDPSGTPASFSRPILRDLLRGEMGFRGVVISDSLLMGAAGQEVSRRAPELVAAGLDVLLDVSHPEIALDALVQAVERGDLAESLLDEAFERIWDLKQKMFGHPAPEYVHRGRDLAVRVARQALLVEGDLEPVLGAPGPIPLLVIRPHLDYPDPTRAEAADLFAAASDRLLVRSLGPDSPEAEREELLGLARRHGRVVVAMVVKPAAWHRFGLLPEQAALVAELVEAVPTLLCSLGSPDADRGFPTPAARMVSFSDVEVSVQAVADRLARVLDVARK